MKRSKLFFTALLFLGILSSCEKDDDGGDQNETSTYDVAIVFEPRMNGATADLTAEYTDAYGRTLTFETIKYYLSNISFVNAKGETEVLDVELIDHLADDLTGKFDNVAIAESKKGTFSQIKFGLGLPPEVNAIDPSVYENSHPLSALNGMYWGWATMYIFSKTEGRIDSDNDGVVDQSWFVHTGMDDLYRSGVTVDRDFTVTGKNDTVTVYLDLEKYFLLNGDTADLVVDGQSHTTDNFDLAEDFTDRLEAMFY